MHSTQREREILELLSSTGSSRILELSKRLGVTEETIRRNVRRLEEAGVVTKVHGGVYLKDWGPAPTFAQRFKENAAAKRLIAKHVSNMIRDGDSLFLDTGSTTAYVAEELRKHQGLLVVTNSLSVAQALTSNGSNRVFFAGGELRSHDGGAFGAEALAFVRQFRVRHAVLSCAAVQAGMGFMLHDLREAEFSRQIIACSERAMIAADATKFAKHASIRLTDPERINYFVCDKRPPSALATWLRAAGIEICLAGETPKNPDTEGDSAT